MSKQIDIIKVLNHSEDPDELFKECPLRAMKRHRHKNEKSRSESINYIVLKYRETFYGRHRAVTPAIKGQGDNIKCILQKKGKINYNCR